MNRDDIISAVSIEFGLSNIQSEKVVTGIFNSIAQELKKNSGFEFKKFGKFKLITDKEKTPKLSSVRFTPSKKLSQRVNSNFENLKKIKLKNDLIFSAERTVEMDPGKENNKSVGAIKTSGDEIQSSKTISGKSFVKKQPDIDFEKTDRLVKSPGKQIQPEKETEQNLSGQRKLISEDLIKLHKEITEEDKTEKDIKDISSDTNLWG